MAVASSCSVLAGMWEALPPERGRPGHSVSPPRELLLQRTKQGQLTNGSYSSTSPLRLLPPAPAGACGSSFRYYGSSNCRPSRSAVLSSGNSDLAVSPPRYPTFSGGLGECQLPPAGGVQLSSTHRWNAQLSGKDAAATKAPLLILPTARRSSPTTSSVTEVVPFLSSASSSSACLRKEPYSLRPSLGRTDGSFIPSLAAKKASSSASSGAASSAKTSPVSCPKDSQVAALSDGGPHPKSPPLDTSFSSASPSAPTCPACPQKLPSESLSSSNGDKNPCHKSTTKPPYLGTAAATGARQTRQGRQAAAHSKKACTRRKNSSTEPAAAVEGYGLLTSNLTVDQPSPCSSRKHDKSFRSSKRGTVGDAGKALAHCSDPSSASAPQTGASEEATRASAPSGKNFSYSDVSSPRRPLSSGTLGSALVCAATGHHLAPNCAYSGKHVSALSANSTAKLLCASLRPSTAPPRAAQNAGKDILALVSASSLSSAAVSVPAVCSALPASHTVGNSGAATPARMLQSAPPAANSPGVPACGTGDFSTLSQHNGLLSLQKPSGTATATTSLLSAIFPLVPKSSFPGASNIVSCAAHCSATPIAPLPVLAGSDNGSSCCSGSNSNQNSPLRYPSSSSGFSSEGGSFAQPSYKLAPDPTKVPAPEDIFWDSNSR